MGVNTQSRETSAPSSVLTGDMAFYPLGGSDTSVAWYFKRPDGSIFTFGTLETAQTWSAAQTYSAGIVLSGTAANLTLGANFISYAGTDAGISLDASNNATLSAGLTLSAGTANGVLYLNGSKAATSGSALQFDGANLGIGVTPSAWGASFVALDIGVGSSIANLNSHVTTAIAGNAYTDGTNWKYKNANIARQLELSTDLSFYGAASGSAGANITWTKVAGISGVAPANSFIVDSQPVLHIGGNASRATTDPTNAINLYNGTAPAGTLTNGATFYVTSGEMWVMDSGGTATQLSSHDADKYWIHNSYNSHTGRRICIDMEKLMLKLASLYMPESVRETVEIAVGGGAHLSMPYIPEMRSHYESRRTH